MTTLSVFAANLQLNELARHCGNGFLRIYDGRKPISVESLPDSILLAELRFQDVAFMDAEGGIIRSWKMNPEMNAKANGTARWARIFSASEEALWDAEAETDLILTSYEIRIGMIVQINSFIHSLPLEGTGQ